MDNQLLIPDKIKVGYCKRDDTYTKKLAYVIYYDKKGVLRKEKSWEGWRDKKINPDDYDNTPAEGFILNRDVGGTRRSYGWNARIEKVRVFDPRNFEFEISIPNLLFILKECSSSKGKGLEGKFVYAWSGSELILLPAECEEFKKSSTFTELQGKSVAIADMIPAATYLTKKQEPLIYLGRFDYHFLVERYLDGALERKADAPGKKKLHLFWREKSEDEDKGFVRYADLKNIGQLQSDVPYPDFAKRVATYNKSVRGSAVESLFLKEAEYKPKNDGDESDGYWYFEEEPGVFAECHNQYEYRFASKRDARGNLDWVCISRRFKLEDGKLVCITRRQGSDVMKAPGSSYNPNNYGHNYYRRQSDEEKNEPAAKVLPFREPTKMRLFAKMANGSTHPVNFYDFHKERY